MLKPKNSNNFMFMLFAVFIGMGFFLQILSLGNVEFSLDMPAWAAILASQALLFGVPSLIYLLLHRGRIRQLLPLRGLGWKNVVMLVAMTLTIQPMIMLLNAVSQLIFPNVIGEVVSEAGRQSGMWITVATIAIVPSIFEEVAYRGIGFAGFRHAPIRKAALLNGLFFGMIHMNMNQFMYAFVVGAVFCYFMYYTKSLWAPVLAHFVFNGTQGLLALAAQGIGAEGAEAMETAAELTTPEIVAAMSILAVLAAAFTAAFIGIYIRFRRHNIKRNEDLGIITDEVAAHREAGGEAAPVFTLAFWCTLALFALLMAANYLAPLFTETLEAVTRL